PQYRIRKHGFTKIQQFRFLLRFHGSVLQSSWDWHDDPTGSYGRIERLGLKLMCFVKSSKHGKNAVTPLQP
ncbi:MAG: hypothetical protein RBS80_17020, partial [Thermoguttaceae bacterium]|nr:hypothetical protein [Thermoguttaceae bacterium]